jgi:hypothetical protein
MAAFPKWFDTTLRNPCELTEGRHVSTVRGAQVGMTRN